MERSAGKARSGGIQIILYEQGRPAAAEAVHFSFGIDRLALGAYKMVEIVHEWTFG
jgi:hypothetical protein